MKRFWTQASVISQDEGWGVALDGRPVRTPARAPLLLPSAALGEAIANEWQAQGDTIEPASMPLTGIANAAIDLAAPDLSQFAEPIAAYAASDLLCYREDRDTVLLGEQSSLWNPLLAWAEAQFAIEFELTQGIIPVDQPAATVTRLRETVFAHDPFRLAALAPIVTIGGSLIAGLALTTGGHDAETLWQAVTLDEIYQERRWGCDTEAQAMRERRKAEWMNAARFLDLL